MNNESFRLAKNGLLAYKYKVSFINLIMDDVKVLSPVIEYFDDDFETFDEEGFIYKVFKLKSIVGSTGL